MLRAIALTAGLMQVAEKLMDLVRGARKEPETTDEVVTPWRLAPCFVCVRGISGVHRSKQVNRSLRRTCISRSSMARQECTAKGPVEELPTHKTSLEMLPPATCHFLAPKSFVSLVMTFFVYSHSPTGGLSELGQSSCVQS